MTVKRAAIIELYRAGKTNSEIIKLLKAPRSTAYYTVTRFRALKSIEDYPRSGKPRCSRTPKAVNADRAQVRHNSKRYMRGMAHDMNVRRQ